jgi:hypothetical protein
MNGLHSMRTLKHESRALEWLLSGDPSIRWQTFCDLTDAPPEAVARERERVMGDGWGKRLLGLQDPEATWAGSTHPSGLQPPTPCSCCGISDSRWRTTRPCAPAPYCWIAVFTITEVSDSAGEGPRSVLPVWCFPFWRTSGWMTIAWTGLRNTCSRGR